MIPTITLADGSQIPQLGFGTFQIAPEATAEVVTQAFEAGYRHIDTAQMYGNEAGVGAAIAASGIPRSDLYVTTKLSNAHHDPAAVGPAFDRSLAELGLDYIDLFLVHWPLPTLFGGSYPATWAAMAELLGDGRLRSIGVSNFEPEHLARIDAETGVSPVVNQIEAHPYFANNTARAAGIDRGIAVEAWSPLGQGTVLADPAIVAIAEAQGRTPAQVVLRWHLDRGDIVFPKSNHAGRMRENLDVFGLELSLADRAAIDALDRGEDGRVGPHPDRFDYVPG